MVSQSNQRIKSQGATISLEPTDKGDLYDKEILKDMLSVNNALFKGFIEMVAYMPSGEMDRLVNDALVFTVDPSADTHIIENPNNKFAHGVFWNLEEFKIISE